MTPSTSVLIAGRSPAVLETTLALLTARGHRARATREFEDITARFDADDLDIVVLGGQIPPDQKADMREALHSVNPSLVIVQGLAGIPGLLVDQVEAAAAGETPIPGQAPVYDADERAITLVLFAPLEVKVTAYWITELVPPNPKSTSAVVTEGTLSAGEHRIRVPDVVARDAAFATVRAGDASWSFRLAPPAG